MFLHLQGILPLGGCLVQPHSEPGHLYAINIKSEELSVSCSSAKVALSGGTLSVCVHGVAQIFVHSGPSCLAFCNFFIDSLFRSVGEGGKNS